MTAPAPYVIFPGTAREALSFYAGQYINILLPDGEKRSVSFATAPGVGREIELQIRRIPGGRYSEVEEAEMRRLAASFTAQEASV